MGRLGTYRSITCDASGIGLAMQPLVIEGARVILADVDKRRRASGRAARPRACFTRSTLRTRRLGAADAAPGTAGWVWNPGEYAGVPQRTIEEAPGRGSARCISTHRFCSMPYRDALMPPRGAAADRQIASAAGFKGTAYAFPTGRRIRRHFRPAHRPLRQQKRSSAATSSIPASSTRRPPAGYAHLAAVKPLGVMQDPALASRRSSDIAKRCSTWLGLIRYARGIAVRTRPGDLLRIGDISAIQPFEPRCRARSAALFRARQEATRPGVSTNLSATSSLLANIL